MTLTVKGYWFQTLKYNLEPTKKKKTFKEKLAEKEERLKKEKEERLKAKELMEKELTAEEKQKRVEESDFQIAQSMLGKEFRKSKLEIF